MALLVLRRAVKSQKKRAASRIYRTKRFWLLSFDSCSDRVDVNGLLPRAFYLMSRFVPRLE